MPTRRSVLLATAAALALAGCASITDDTPSPETLEADGGSLDRAIAHEYQLSALASTVASRAGSWGLSQAMADWCTGLAQAHDTHLTALRRSEALGGTGADDSPVIALPSPSPTPPNSPVEALAQLVAGEAAAAQDHRSQLTSTTTGSQAMFWASLFTFASASRTMLSNHTDGSVPAAGLTQDTAVPAVVQLGGFPERLSTVVKHLDVLRYGLETMEGRARIAGSAQADVMATRRTDVEEQRNVAATQLAAASSAVPAPALAYELPGDAGDPTAWQMIWGTLEARVLDARIAAAAVAETGDNRNTAVNALDAQAGQAVSHGVGPTTWPGWV